MDKIQEDQFEKRTSLHIVALVLGIISIITSFFWYMVLPTGILAIIFGVKTNREYNSALGKAGLILGIVGLSLFAFLYFTMISIMILPEYYY